MICTAEAGSELYAACLGAWSPFPMICMGASRAYMYADALVLAMGLVGQCLGQSGCEDVQSGCEDFIASGQYTLR